MKTNTTVIPAIIAEAIASGCENAEQINGYLAAEVSRLRAGNVDPDTADEGKEWCIFVWDSVNDMGECAHGRMSAKQNLDAIIDEMEDGDVVEMRIRRKDMTPEELAALPDAG